MSPIARKFFKASLIYLSLGLLSQAVVGFDVWLGFNPLAYTTLVATEQILLIGWLTQLGLALIYDRWLRQPSLTGEASSKDQTSAQARQVKLKAQGSQLDQLVFVLFNLGLPLVVVGQPGLAIFGGPWLGMAAALGGILQVLAGLLFVVLAWGAIRKN